MYIERSKKWSNRANRPKLRTIAELKEAILNVLTANKGRIISAEELHKALPIKWDERLRFQAAFRELVDEGKIKQYIGLP